MKTFVNIKTALLLFVLAISIQSCHIGLGIGIGSAKDKNAADKKTEITSKTTEKDTNKSVGPTISK
jgi:hypothetical protein